jgi:hypothetical protein
MNEHRTSSLWGFAGLSAALAFSACVGTVGGVGSGEGSNGTGGNAGGQGGSTNGVSSSGNSGTSSTTGGGSPSTANAFVCTSTTPDPGPTSILQLTRAQYTASLQSLFGSVVPDLTNALGPDNSYQTSQFGLVQGNIDVTGVQAYENAAEAVAAAVVGSQTTLNAIAPCSASGTAQRTCAQTFVTNFGALAYRAPITDSADIARHLALYDVGATTSYAHGIELVLRGMLQSTRFLYRYEVGTGQQMGPNAIKLSGYEIAARLAFDIWGTVPDAQLTQAAASGGLSTTDGISTQLTRMLQDPKGAVLTRFLGGLIQLPALPYASKDPTMYPAWNAAGSTLPASMQGQAQAFFADVLANQGGTVSALLTSTKVFANKDLASYYGVSGVTSSTFQAVQPTVGQASGLLTLPALMTLEAKPDESWPIYRGEFVREALLCQQLPQPPANVPPPPTVTPGVSTRARLTQHETLAQCSACHQLMDPIGFGFENFDAVGQFRTTDGNQPVDASGNIISTNDINGPFNGVVQLGKILSGSTQVQQCVARQWFRYTMSRFEQDPDNCSMNAIFQKLQSSGMNLNSLPQALVQSDAFLYRRPISESNSTSDAGSAEVSP